MPKKIHRRPDADPQEGVRKYGKVKFADPANRKYPIDSPGQIKAAWAYIHQPENAAKYTQDEVRTRCGLERPVGGNFRIQRKVVVRVDASWLSHEHRAE